MQWKEKKLVTEFTVKEKIRDVAFLHNENMFAVAQKQNCYIYDDHGIEIHALKHFIEPKFLEFLPYHFLLTCMTKRGHLKYQDVTTGEVVAEHKTKKGEPMALA